MFKRYGDYPTSVLISRITESEKKIFVSNILKYNRSGMVKQASSHTLRCLLYLFMFNKSISNEILDIELPSESSDKYTSISTRILYSDYIRYKNLINKLRVIHTKKYITSSNTIRRLILWYNSNPSIAETVITEYKYTV